jgi:hypothetical protein
MLHIHLILPHGAGGGETEKWEIKNLPTEKWE